MDFSFYVRVRNPQLHEMSLGEPGEVTSYRSSLTLHRSSKSINVNEQLFSFPARTSVIFDGAEIQNNVTKKLSRRLSKWEHNVVIAHGPTSGGKTHTIFSPPFAVNEISFGGCRPPVFPSEWGLAARLLSQSIGAGVSVSAIEVKVRVDIAKSTAAGEEWRSYDLFSSIRPLTPPQVFGCIRYC